MCDLGSVDRGIVGDFIDEGEVFMRYSRVMLGCQSLFELRM